MAAIAAVLPHMTKNQEFIIQQRCEDMIRYGYVALRRFPKSERHVLSAEIRHTMLDLLALVIRVKKRFFKKTSLQDLDICIDTLRSQIRLASCTACVSSRLPVIFPWDMTPCGFGGTYTL
jgi:hypothetical protein